MRMFPRQYGLNNVFIQCDTARSTSLFGVYNTAAPMAPAASAKVPRHPWRLRQMREQVEKMLELNSMCAYKLLLQYYCPVKAIDEPSVTVDTSSAALLTYHSSFDQVTSFVHAVVKKVIPLAMFGSQENRIVILRAMTRFIRLRKFETMSLQYVLQGFRMSDCQWLQDTRLRKPDSRVHHTPPTASDKQHEILHEFLYWMFDGFLIPLLQASFYITDSSFQRNKIFYYRHELWQLITKPAVASIQKDMFIQLEQGEIAKCNQTYAKVRLLPKIHDLRPIINLRKKSSKLVNGTSSIGVKSMNQKLMNPFLILAYERDRQMAQRTSSAIGMSDLFYRCKQAKSRLVDSSGSESPKLYMVKVDIKKSFDSINQDKLLEIIDRVLKEDKYMIHRHSKVVPSNGRIMKRFLPKAIAATEVPPFLEFARDQAKMSKHAVIVDKVVHSYEGKTAVINMIRDHINTNIVKFGKHFYRQTTGIPQGSILSPALCRFFYDEMELNVLSDLTQSSDSELIRLADDFLFISQSREKAVSFLEIMAKGHPDYGCFINEKKTIVNFDVTLNGVPVQTCQGNEFPYCGLLLHTRTLEIRADYSRYHGEVGRDMHPGRSITLKMKKGMQHMCQMAFSDTTFNSLSKVMLNIFQNFLFCAMKFHAYCQELRLDPVSAEHVHATALPSIVMGILRACYGLLHNGRRSAVGISASVKFEVAERHVQWLGATAFCRVLPRWPVYAPLRAMLQDKILGPLAANEKVHFKRMLHSIVSDERNKIMDNIRYT
ncbi:hypothetical protein BGZ54_004884 [Gamsiella multidivaricata]|nr:hypothetical protein BGZ54_004884 [Gamsiella multidivaricata]